MDKADIGEVKAYGVSVTSDGRFKTVLVVGQDDGEIASHSVNQLEPLFTRAQIEVQQSDGKNTATRYAVTRLMSFIETNCRARHGTQSQLEREIANLVLAAQSDGKKGASK